ncbi:MAG: hypothetical protein ACSLFA_06820 [Mycobacterium sp.]
MNSTDDAPDEQPTPAEATAAPSAPEPTAPPRAWSRPKAPVSREQVDHVGRVAGKTAMTAITAIAKAVASLARFGARLVGQIWRALAAVPPALQLLSVAAVLVLLGIVGSIALSGTPALLCTIVVVPVCSVALGALGHRWLGRSGSEQTVRTDDRRPEPTTADLSRSIVYVDKKLTVALNSLGSERHQQAVIALFQAKTAVELALGTEQDEAGREDAPVQVDAYRLRPRIQAGPRSAVSPKSDMAESNSLAAS